MRRYIRQRQPGGIYFFTVVTQARRPILATDGRVEILRSSFRWVKRRHPFEIDAIVILPDHIHCIWRLPNDDDNYPVRWSLIKRYFSRKSNIHLPSSASNIAKRESGIWQRRYWEHLIRDERDWRDHMDYIHYNPVKHGLAKRVRDWPYSSFSKCVERGWYEDDWGTHVPKGVLDMEFE